MVGARALQAVQRLQQRLERPTRQRARGVLRFVGLKRVQPFGLEHAFGLVRKQHRVTVKGNTHFGGVGVAGADRLRVHLRGGHIGLQGGSNIAQVGGQKQISA